MLSPVDLATFKTTDDGNLEVTLQRFGRLTIFLPNSSQTIEVLLRRDSAKQFGCFVQTDVAGDEKAVASAIKRNKGERPQATYRLLSDGSLDLEEAQPKAQRDSAVGRGAASADEGGQAVPPAGDEAPLPESPESEDAAEEEEAPATGGA